MNSEQQRRAKLAKVKLQLADKYTALAQAAKSTVKRRQFLHHAKVHRRQAQDLSAAS
jgi:hypothetical protein